MIRRINDFTIINLVHITTIGISLKPTLIQSKLKNDPSTIQIFCIRLHLEFENTVLVPTLKTRHRKGTEKSNLEKLKIFFLIRNLSYNQRLKNLKLIDRAQGRFLMTIILIDVF